MIYNERFREYFVMFIFCLDSFLLGFRGVIINSYYSLGIYLSLMALFIYATLFILLFLQSYRLSELLFILILLGISILIYKAVKTAIPFYTILFIIATKNKSLAKIFKYNLYGIVFAYGLVILLAITGFIHTEYNPIENSNSLGFINPNGLAGRALYITVLIVFLYSKRLTVLSYFLLFGHALLIGMVSKSRTGLALSLFAIVGSIIIRKSRYLRNLLVKHIRFFLFAIVLLCIAGFIFCQTVPFLHKIDAILTGRFRWAQIYFITYGVNLFGSITDDISEAGYGALVLDNGYAYLIVKFGIIYFLTFIALYFIAASILKNMKDYNGLFLILITFIGLITETGWIPINTNITICLCSIAIYNQNIGKKMRTNKLVRLCCK